jgi:hypothetical protein
MELTAKEKADELINKFIDLGEDKIRAKYRALITINEILSLHPLLPIDFSEKYFNYWIQVKEEIKNQTK